jgi:hypothetical protein
VAVTDLGRHGRGRRAAGRRGRRDLLTALEPLARPTTADDEQSAAQRRADALTELARRALEDGRLPQSGGVRPQVTVTIDLASLLGQPARPTAEGRWVGPLAAETARRLACDASLTRVVVTRDPHQPARDGGTGDPARKDASHPAGDLAARLQAAVALLPPAVGGARPEPLAVGRATRVVAPPQRTALTVRDGGCRFPGGDRPVAWCDAHHLRHWLHGGPPTWTTWCCCAAATITRYTRAAGGCTATPMGRSPRSHSTDDDNPPPPERRLEQPAERSASRG